MKKRLEISAFGENPVSFAFFAKEKKLVGRDGWTCTTEASIIVAIPIYKQRSIMYE
jgi:hypothetical protein